MGLRAVADAAGVSTATVSNVLNRPDLVSAELRLRVDRAVRELGYVPNIAARSLRTGYTASIGAVFFDVANPFFAMIARHMGNEASDRGYALIVMSSDQKRDREDAGLDFLVGHGVRGIAVTTAYPDLAALLDLQEKGFEITLLAQESDHPDIGSISIDDELGMTLLTRHLIEGGRRRIGFINGPGTARQHIRRRNGILGVLEDAGLDPAEYLVEIVASAPDSDGGYSATLELLAQGHPLDALMCVNDYTAVGAIAALESAGLSVPDDIAVTGFDDVELASVMAVPLTTIRQPLAKLGRLAADVLMNAIEDREFCLPRVVLPPELVVRRSTTR